MSIEKHKIRIRSTIHGKTFVKAILKNYEKTRSGKTLRTQTKHSMKRVQN